MISVLCRSAFLAKNLAQSSGMQTTVFIPDSNEVIQGKQWLGTCLRQHVISVVFYEPYFFVDPAYFRSLSPNTRFVIISGPGEEVATTLALSSGAVAVLHKPVNDGDFHGVLDFVC